MSKFLVGFFIIFSSQLFLNAQCDYSRNQYSFKVEKGIFYGVVPDYRGIMDSLFLDVYSPVGSPELTKPLIIWAFGGGFFQGKREDFASICEEMAKRGIISATIDYRLGFDGPGLGLNPPFAFDAAEVLRAGYRGVTDMKGAIRFLKGKSSDYEIDLDRIWLGGASAGAMVALNAAFLNKDSEKPKETGAISPANAKQRPDLGPVEGTLNLNGHNTEVQGVFNIFGALLDTLAVDATDRIAVISYHQTNDPIVPCVANTPYYPIPLISQNYPVVYGSCVITERFKYLGIPETHWETWIYPGTEHAVHNQNAVLDFMIENAKPFLCKNITAQNNETQSSLYLLPNPAGETIQIPDLKNSAEYKIMNMSGHIMAKGLIKRNAAIDVTELPSGLYILELRQKNTTTLLKWIKS
ncbi:MAG: T9SS type A sorting domain-containing protein [Saprospiraceae bacterium]|nr:T9SS type A sorting domain-containing protein [Saprospiraceae bacterium]